MKKLLAASILLLSVLIVCCAFSDTADAASEEGILLIEVKPANDEGFSLHNYSSRDINLCNEGYSLTDGEGTFTFNTSLVIKSGQTITFVSKIVDDSKFSNRHTTIKYGDNGTKADKTFALRDDGDDIYLLKNQTKIDAFCYGDTTIVDSNLWNDKPLHLYGKGYTSFAVRDNSNKGSLDNWHAWGITNYRFDPDYKIDATVTPFVFPNHGGIPIYQAIEEAKESIYLTMYLLISENICGLLLQKINDGVSVNILLERSPLGYCHDESAILTLHNAGANIKCIGSSGDRYDYVHAKYCIIDGKRVIITSENWVASNLSGKIKNTFTSSDGNRGWGAIIDSKEYATFMRAVFDNDSNEEYYDVLPFIDCIDKTRVAKPLTYIAPESVSDDFFKSYKTKITPILSPDNSWDTEMYYISNSTERIYTQQQSLDPGYDLLWMECYDESPIRIMYDKLTDNVDIKVLLDSKAEKDYKKNKETYHYDPVKDLNSLNIPSAYISKPTVHNKGLICDNVCVVCSVNWTDNSFTNNRETGIVIHSSEITNYYCDFFNTDFSANYKQNGLTVSISEITDHYDESDPIIATATVVQSGTFTYNWKLDGKELNSHQERVIVKTSKGNHTLLLEVIDSNGIIGSTSHFFTVGNISPDKDPTSDETEQEKKSDLVEEYGTYAIPIIVVILGLFAALLKGSSGKKKKVKKGGKKR